RVGASIDLRQSRGERWNLLAADQRPVGESGDRVLIIVVDARNAELRPCNELRKRLGVDPARLPIGAELRSRQQCYASGAGERVREQLVVNGVGREGEVDVVEDAARFGGGQLVDELCLGSAWPWPVAEFAQSLVVYPDDHDLTAGAVLVEGVAGDSQPVFCNLAEANQAEDQPRHRRPQQQLPRLAFQA